MLGLKGKVIGGKYEILEAVVPGAGAVTFVAKEVGTEERFFLRAFSKKFLSMVKSNTAYAEYKTGKDTNSPFLSKDYAAYQDDSHLYVVSEFLQGGDLFYFLRSGNSNLSEDVARFFAAQVLLGIEALHNQKIVFRNIKPEAVSFDSKGNCKLSNFEFSKKIESTTFTLCGTPDYLSPELVTGHSVTLSTDIWSFGVLVYEMVAGFPPFFDEDPMRTYMKIMERKYAFPSTFSPEVMDLIKTTLVEKSKRPEIEKLKAHPWFASVNWEALAAGEVKSPFVPELSSKDDLKYFEIVEDHEDENLYFEETRMNFNDESFLTF